MQFGLLEESKRRYLKLWNALSVEVVQQLEESYRPFSIGRKTILLQPGEVCRYTWFVESGAMRKFALSDTREITTDLFIQGDIAVVFSSYCLQIASAEWLEALTNTKGYRLEYAAFEQLKQQYQPLQILDQALTEHHALVNEYRLYQLQFLSAEERYAAFLERCANWEQLVPLRYIASYLNVSAETLSRLRGQARHK
jgi:CRP-like cAMP-binding protein